MADSDQGKTEEQDPTAEPTPQECDATAAQCEVDQEDLNDDELLEATAHEEVQDAFPNTPIKMATSPDDGMPIPAEDDTDYELIPPFTREHCVCIEDDRKYVERFTGDLYAWNWLRRAGGPYDADYGFSYSVEMPMPDVTRAPKIFARTRFDAAGKPRERRCYDPSEVVERWGRTFVEPESGVLIPVRPIRERCRYYKRQIFAEKRHLTVDHKGDKWLARNCMMRRSIGGAFLSVRDEAVYACDYRDPPDDETVRKHLDEPDRERLESRAHLKMVPAFGL